MKSIARRREEIARELELIRPRLDALRRSLPRGQRKIARDSINQIIDLIEAVRRIANPYHFAIPSDDDPPLETNDSEKSFHRRHSEIKSELGLLRQRLEGIRHHLPRCERDSATHAIDQIEVLLRTVRRIGSKPSTIHVSGRIPPLFS